jgi:hypothetical protein
MNVFEATTKHGVSETGSTSGGEDIDCGLAGGYRRFGETYCLHIEG